MWILTIIIFGAGMGTFAAPNEDACRAAALAFLASDVAQAAGPDGVATACTPLLRTGVDA